LKHGPGSIADPTPTCKNRRTRSRPNSLEVLIYIEPPGGKVHKASGAYPEDQRSPWRPTLRSTWDSTASQFEKISWVRFWLIFVFGPYDTHNEVPIGHIVTATLHEAIVRVGVYLR
jgi:hypothetical protein